MSLTEASILITGGQCTTQEISQQPVLWRELAADLNPMLERTAEFLLPVLQDPSARIFFTGAGSSGFIAEMVADTVNQAWAAESRAVHTTSLLSHPGLYLDADRSTVIVSFGRSGSSPESIGVVELVRRLVPGAKFLNITCNADGELARGGLHHADTCNVLMPPASCDRGFAMTSSLTCMLLATLAIFSGDSPSDVAARLQTLADHADSALRQWNGTIRSLAQSPFSRVVYLGGGPLESVSREAALKLLELTGGRVASFANTPLGFRHGPKSLLDSQTLVVVLRSNEETAARYDQDLIAELQGDGVAGQVLTVGAGQGDLALPVAEGIHDVWLAPLWLIFAQLYALHRSAGMQLTPDNPFPDGTVNRVVQGVKIYPYG